MATVKTEKAPRFNSNKCVAIHVKDLKKPETFYSNVMGFKLKEKRSDCLVYDTGLLELYVVKDTQQRPPVPSFTVKDLQAAREYLLAKGCKVVTEPEGGWLYFQDPNGFVFDLIER